MCECDGVLATADSGPVVWSSVSAPVSQLHPSPAAHLQRLDPGRPRRGERHHHLLLQPRRRHHRHHRPAPRDHQRRGRGVPAGRRSQQLRRGREVRELGEAEVTRGRVRSVEVSGGQWRSPEVGREHGEDLLQPLGPRPVPQLAVVEGHVVAGGGRGGHRAAAGLLLSTTSRPLHCTLHNLYSSIHIHIYISTNSIHWCIYLCICQPPHPPRDSAGWRSAAAATSAPAPGPPSPPAEAEAAPSWSWGAGWRGRRGPPSDGSWCVRAGPGPGPHCRGWPRPPPAAHRIDLCS